MIFFNQKWIPAAIINVVFNVQHMNRLCFLPDHFTSPSLWEPLKERDIEKNTELPAAWAKPISWTNSAKEIQKEIEE